MIKGWLFQNGTASITVGSRQSNFELLRIVAMLMILGLHANFLSLDKPCPEYILATTSIIRVLLQAICIVAVNVFVMISGWFGIRRSWKGYCNFAWQVFFIVGFSNIVGSLIFGWPINIKSLLMPLGLFGGGGWFVGAYIGLYILAPIINAYIEATSTRNLVITVCVFIVFQTIFGDTLSAAFIVMGYSTFSFIGLYLIAALLKRYQYVFSVTQCVSIFIACSILNSIIYVWAARLGVFALREIVFNYINPIVIAQASALLLLFSKITPPVVSTRLSVC